MTEQIPSQSILWYLVAFIGASPALVAYHLGCGEDAVRAAAEGHGLREGGAAWNTTLAYWHHYHRDDADAERDLEYAEAELEYLENEASENGGEFIDECVERMVVVAPFFRNWLREQLADSGGSNEWRSEVQETLITLTFLR